MVTTRSEMRSMRSTPGINRISPGPFAPTRLPKRNITPRSYSRRMRTACGAMKTRARMPTTRNGVLAPMSLVRAVMISIKLSF